MEFLAYALNNASDGETERFFHNLNLNGAQEIKSSAAGAVTPARPRVRAAGASVTAPRGSASIMAMFAASSGTAPTVVRIAHERDA